MNKAVFKGKYCSQECPYIEQHSNYHPNDWKCIAFEDEMGIWMRTVGSVFDGSLRIQRFDDCIKQFGMEEDN